MKHPSQPRRYQHNDLFRPGQPSHLNACVGLNGGPYDAKAYARGYFKAGERIGTSILESRATLDLVIYPLVFTYRHGIELSLKYLATRLGWLWNHTLQPFPTHRLIDNWNLVYPYLKRAPVFDPADTIADFVDLVIRDFVSIDPTGEAFRYPEARAGSPFLQNLSLINCVVFTSSMTSVAEALEYWMWRTDDCWQEKAQAEADQGA